MDISTGLGLLAGAVVLSTLILMGGDLRMFLDVHAAIVIFGGSFAATLIRFPLGSIFHGLPLGARFAFTLRRMSQRELVDEIAGLAEIARKQGPIGLEKVEIEDPFLAKGVRFVADGYDSTFIRDNLERDRDNFLTHLDERCATPASSRPTACRPGRNSRTPSASVARTPRTLRPRTSASMIAKWAPSSARIAPSRSRPRRCGRRSTICPILPKSRSTS